jgi:hypothetical protein
LSDPVLETGKDERLRSLVKSKDKEALRTLLLHAHHNYADPARGLVKQKEDSAYQDWYLLDTKGNMLACATHVPGDLPYNWRDYFVGAMRRAGKTGKDSVYVSKMYKGDRTQIYLFAIAAPVYSAEDQREVIGVIAATITTRPWWREFDPSDDRRTAVLVGPKDPNPPRGDGRAPANEANEFLVALHPAYQLREQAVPVKNDMARLIHQPKAGSVFQLPEPPHSFGSATDAFYHDPFADREDRFTGRWLAGFAPVGNTGYAVVVQQRYDDAIPSHHDIFWGAIAVLLGFLLIVPLGWVGFQRLTRSRE